VCRFLCCDRPTSKVVKDPPIPPNFCILSIDHSSNQAMLQRFAPARIALHVLLACFFLVARINSVSWKYLPLRTPAHKDSGLVMRRHPCFPSIARIKHRRSRNPIPPLHFGWFSRSQLIQCMCRLSAELPHQ